ncbi:unnamed protein product [Didymodactylos carnosus]|uniref:Ankyrin repeat protein n=1 Tax=Didymodactylos carnosus TaxID=1234261 RepID=A0A813TFK9_9BILA|nr:unnamed protein product [Didymodactylos carnosus]CAF1125297.1 unnamed protein product [Didymodactylos carnosus]CAF3594191.1 unnamed protein product [Didymodactylos carnosus]CAF3902585.1 unnamed protein product [Didymodactylos carnosus]
MELNDISVKTRDTVKIIQQRLNELCYSSCENGDEENIEQRLEDILNELDLNNQKYLIDVEDNRGQSPLFYAIETQKSLKFIKILLEHDARITDKILVCAVRKCNFEILELLKTYGANFNKTVNGWSLLHDSVLLHNNELLEYLIDQGIDPNGVDGENQTPLLLAVYRSNIDVIRLLLKYPNVDPCVVKTAKKGLTSLHVACEIGLDDVIPLMIKSSSSNLINRQNTKGQTAFDCFLSCYLFNKNDLYMNENGLKVFTTIFNVFVEYGGKLNRLSKSYRRTRAPYIVKILTILFQKNDEFFKLFINPEIMINDLEQLIYDSLSDTIRLASFKGEIKVSIEQTKQIMNDPLLREYLIKEKLLREQILREVFDLFFLVHKSSFINLTYNQLLHNCHVDSTKPKIRQALWLLIKDFYYIRTSDDGSVTLKSACRKNILLNLKSIQTCCYTKQLEIPKYLEKYLLFLE